MIYLYSGTPGSGKSLNLARFLYHSMKRGYPSIANFQFGYHGKTGNEFTYIDNADLDTPMPIINYALNYWKESGKPIKEGTITVILDECQILFNARQWNCKGRSDWVKFFTQHRKYGIDVILCCQFDLMLDKQLRALIEYNVIHRKVSNFGVRGRILSLFYGGKMHVAVTVWYPLNQKIGSRFFRVRKKYYRLYDTFDTFESFALE